MLNRIVVILAAAAFIGGAVPIQTAQARGYYDNDDIWDLMDPSWWFDEMFDDNDDDWWRYHHYRYSPYWGGHHWGAPYRRSPQVIVIQEPEPQPPEIRAPE